MSNTIYDEWESTVRRTAARTVRENPDVEYDDLSQDLWVVIYEQQWDRPTASTVEVLGKVAARKAAEYRQQALILSPQHSYRSGDVRKTLDKIFSYTDWVSVDATYNPTANIRGKGGEPAYEMDDVLAEHSDIRWAWSYLPHDYKRVVFQKHALLEEFERGSAEERRYYRALERLADLLNSYRPPRHRRP